MAEDAYSFYQKNEKMNWVCCSCIKEKQDENNLYELVSGMIKKSEEEKMEMINLMKNMNEKMTKIEGEQNVRLNKICEQITKLEDKWTKKSIKNLKAPKRKSCKM